VSLFFFFFLNNRYNCVSRSWAASNLAPTLKRGVGTAFIVSLSNSLAVYVSDLSDSLQWVDVHLEYQISFTSIRRLTLEKAIQ
jgi:hypothetical protein